MSDIWNHWLGQIVDGTFPLGTYLGGSDYSAVFLTERPGAEGPRKAAIKLIPASAENPERQLARWRLAARLSHPHLLPLYERGCCELGEVPVLYVVMEYAEENLAQVLGLRALSPDEARSMLEPVLGVLGYLHAKDLIHGHIKPTNLMACGDRLMLSSDGIRRAGEPLDSPGRPDAYDAPEAARGVIPGAALVAPAGDVWSLGVTLVEALTQKLPAPLAAETPATNDETALLAALPEPFQQIVRHAITPQAQSRWSVAQIAMRLEGGVPPRRAAEAPSRPAVTGAPAAGPVRAAAGAAVRTAAPRPEQAAAARANRYKRYLYALPLLAAVIVAAALTVPKLLRNEQAHSGKAIPAATAPQAAAPAAPARGRNAERSASSRDVRPAAAVPPTAAAAAGAVARKVLPRIPKSASHTVTGTVRVAVRVDVNATGKVTRAEIASPGPSKYFARKSAEAAPEWRFVPPRVNGRRVASRWLIRFGYTYNGPHASAEQMAP